MTKFIDAQTIEDYINYPELVDQIENYYQKLKEGKVSVTSRIFNPTVEGGVFIVGGATNFETESFIVMSQLVMPWLRDKAEPVARTSYLYTNYKTGELKAVVTGGDLVRYRTPAKSALVAKYLAPKKSKYTLGLIGLGIQAITHAEAFKSMFNINRIVAHSRTPQKWQHNIDAINESLYMDVEILSREEVIEQSDILIIITSAKEPLLNFSDLHKGQLVIGTDHAETVAKDVVLKADKVFVDYRPTAENEIGPVKILLDEGQKYEDIVDGDLLQLATGELKGRESEDEIIFFQSLGVLHENLATVEYLYEKTK